MHPTQHSTIPRRGPRQNAQLDAILTQAVQGLQLLALQKAQRETHTMHIEPPHAPLLRSHATPTAGKKMDGKNV